jgi:hypothetical protein
MSLTIELKDSAEQTAFNLKRWAEVLADRELARLPHRIRPARKRGGLYLVQYS